LFALVAPNSSDYSPIAFLTSHETKLSLMPKSESFLAKDTLHASKCQASTVLPATQRYSQKGSSLFGVGNEVLTANDRTLFSAFCSYASGTSLSSRPLAMLAVRREDAISYQLVALTFLTLSHHASLVTVFRRALAPRLWTLDSPPITASRRLRIRRPKPPIKRPPPDPHRESQRAYQQHLAEQTSGTAR
jgi:hypothetical protein